MNSNEIHNGKDYIAKIGHSQVKVKVMNGSDHGWLVRTAAGKFISINDSKRFTRPVEHAVPAVVNPPAEPREPQIPVSKGTTETVPPAATLADKPKKLSILDAAAAFLKNVANQMSAKELIFLMEDTQTWKSPTGKTPWNTLATAISKEMNKEKPRFQKTGKGLFALAENTQGGEPCAN